MDWNNLYVKYPEFCIKEPAEEVVEFIPLIQRLRGNPKDKKIYDLGFGSGRHIIYLAKLGYQMFGDDISRSGKRITEVWLKKEGLTATLGISDMTRIPYADNFFDAIINRGVITHNTKENIEKCIAEMYRTLKGGGLILSTFISTESSEYGKGILTEPNTYIATSGPEKGVKHHFVDRNEAKALMKDFRKIKLYHYKHRGILKIGNYISAHWIFVGEKP